jgi:hypothetical protein
VIGMGLRLLREFLAAYPENPVADEAAYSLISTYLDLEMGDAVTSLCPIFRERWPDTRLKSSLEYAEAFALFETGRFDAARNRLARVADREDRNLTAKEKDDRDLARYILGQIEHAAGRVAAALARYTQVKDKFDDAAEAIEYFKQKEISLPEVSTFRIGEPVELTLEYRNVEKAVLSVYKVDLMKLYLARKSLSTITDINLAGIKPILTREIALGSDQDYESKKKTLSLSLEDKGAYLLVIQGYEIGCSGMVLLSDLELEVQENAVSGRVRVNVKDARTGAFQKGVHLKVIGSEDRSFQSGATDLRGVFVAENVTGTTAVIADRDGEYAFHRGREELQPFEKEEQLRKAPERSKDIQSQEFRRNKRGRALQNVIQSNMEIQQRGRILLDSIYEQAEEGVQIK